MINTEKYEDVPCPLCGTESYVPVYLAKERLGISCDLHSLVRCKCCGLLFQNPRIKPKVIGEFYPKYYYSTRAGRNQKNLKRARHIIETKARIVESCKNMPGRLLEVGSANGDFLKEMKSRGWEAEGIEVSCDAAEYATRELGVKTFCGSVLDRPEDGKLFDIIVLWAVLPHIPDPVETFRRLSSMLSKDGRIIICFANEGSFAMKLMGRRWGHLDQPRHYCMWRPSTLEKLLAVCSLKLLRIIPTDGLWGDGIRCPGTNFFRKRGKPISSIGVLIDRIFALPFSMFAKAIGREGILTAVVGRKGYDEVIVEEDGN